MFLALSSTALVFAQDTPNKKQQFNGTWIFDAKKSNVGSNVKRLYKNQTLEITYSEPELRIVKTQTMDGKTKSAALLFFTDNRGEKNRPYPFNETLEITSNTTWEKDKLVRKFAIKVYNSGNPAEDVKSQEIYIISEDGETLTIVEETQPGSILNLSPAENGEITASKRVYKRKTK